MRRAGFGAVPQIYICAGVCQNAVVKLRLEPSHGKSDGSTRTSSERQAAFGVFRQLYVSLFFGTRQDLGFHIVGVLGRNGIVFHAALGAAIGNHDGHHHGKPVVGNHVVKNGRQGVAHPVGIRRNDDWFGGARHILGGNINADVPLERPVDAGIEFALGRIHDEFDNPALGNTGAFGLFRGRRVLGPDRIIAITGSRMPGREV
jgi:hypothetical protein